MASFLGHLYGSAAVSAAAALAVDGLGWVESDQIQVLFVLGVIGGLLPDIDSDKSTPVKVFFTLLGVAAAFLVSFTFVEGYQVVERCLIWGAVFLMVRFGLFEIFTGFTVHRGVWHSWLAAAFAALAVVNGAHHFAGFTAWESWLAGLFVALGYLTHLCLDEIASVDLLSNRVKRSFGTAFKPFSVASPGASATMFLGTLVLAYIAPTVEPIVTVASRLQEDVSAFSFWSPR